MRGLGERWRPIGWSALLVMVATGAPLAVARAARTAARAAKAVFAVKMALFAALLVFAYLHDFVLGPRVAQEIRGGTSAAQQTSPGARGMGVVYPYCHHPDTRSRPCGDRSDVSA